MKKCAGRDSERPQGHQKSMVAMNSRSPMVACTVAQSITLLYRAVLYFNCLSPPANFLLLEYLLPVFIIIQHNGSCVLVHTLLTCDKESMNT